MVGDPVSEIRKFSRFYTGRVGALDEQFLGRDRPLGEARFLFEIGMNGSTIADLRDRLGLDSGYASRLLRRLEEEGLATTEPDRADGRRRVVNLTAAGKSEWLALDRLSDEQANSILAPLAGDRAEELARLLSRARRIMQSSTLEIVPIDPRSKAAQTAVAAYFAELDDLFPSGFDAGDALTADADAYDPPTGAFVVARSAEGEIAGCGGLWTFEPGIGEIKRMWVDPEWRGFRLAGRILRDLEQRSRAMGHTRTILDTNGALEDAIAMYERSGYAEIARYNDNPYAERWFEKRW